MSPPILVGAGILLLCVGVGLGYLLAHGLRNREASKANDIQNELDDYRERVTEHFAETSEHFQAIGQQYRSLYKHMASGADALCDATKSEALLGFAASDPEVITKSDADVEPAAPEVIRDYAVADENEAAEMSEDIEAESLAVVEDAKDVEIDDGNSAVEVTAELDQADDTRIEASDSLSPIAEDVAAEKIGETKTVESERTVH